MRKKILYTALVLVAYVGVGSLLLKLKWIEKLPFYPENTPT
jgi:hypothetical protein